MIVDSRNSDQARLVADIVIVGTGAAGVTLAGELDDGKRRIVLVEAGGIEIDEEFQPDTFFESIGEPADTITDQFHALGGLTRYWTGRVGMMDPIDLAKRPWVDRSGWPLEWSELAALEDRAMRWCGFPADWQNELPPLDRLKALKGRPSSLLPYAWRHWATGPNAFKHWGRHVTKAFGKSDNVTVLLHAVMTGIGEWADNRARSCVLRSWNGREIIVEARHFVLCCGGVETPRLLLNMAEREPRRMAAAAPMLGRCFMQHYRVASGTVMASGGQSAQLQSAFNRFVRRRGLFFQTGVCLSPDTQKRNGLLNAAGWIDYRRDRRGWADFTPQALARSASDRLRGHALRLHHIGGIITLDVEQEPCHDSRVLLVDRRDRNGMREAAVDWRVSPLDRRTLSVTTGLIVDWINRLGLGQARAAEGIMGQEAPPTECLLDSHHHLGATRMSISPDDGVVDPDLKVHGIYNLHVCSGSVLPTGGHINPTLTIVALAIRLAQRIACTD